MMWTTLWMMWITLCRDMKKRGGCRSIRPASLVAGQRQRVVIRKPMNAMPNPTKMFHEPSAATGSAPWLT